MIFPERLVEPVDHDRRQAERDLVEQHQFGRGHEGAADGQHLLLAARKRGTRVPALVAEHLEELEHLVAPAQPLALGRSGPPAEQEVLLDGEVGDDAPGLHEVGEPRPHHLVAAPLVDRPAVERDLACGDRDHPADRPRRGRLPCAVRAEHREHLAFGDIERDVLQGLKGAVSGRDVLHLRAVSSVGATFPLHCTANGKSVLSLLPDAQLSELLPAVLPAYTENTVTERKTLLAEIAEIRAGAPAVDREEHTLGICAMGIAVGEAHGRHAAITVPMPTQRFPGREAAIAAALEEARREAQRRLGER